MPAGNQTGASRWARAGGVLSLVLVLAIALQTASTLPRSLLGRATARALLAEIDELPAARSQAEVLAGMDCRSHYFWGLTEAASGRVGERDEAWASLVSCAPAFIPLLENLLPTNVALAEAAFESTGHPEASFWLAQALSAGAIDRSIALYRQALSAKPHDGRRWGELGQLLEERSEPGLALEAYLHSCQNGDPPESGCRSAARLALKQGDVDSAIFYYRQSYRAGNQAAAARLEQGILEPVKEQ